MQAQKACDDGCGVLASTRIAMSYVGSDTRPINERLPQHPHILLLFQWALGRHLTPHGTTQALHVVHLPHTPNNKVSTLNNVTPFVVQCMLPCFVLLLFVTRVLFGIPQQ